MRHLRKLGNYSTHTCVTASLAAYQYEQLLEDGGWRLKTVDEERCNSRHISNTRLNSLLSIAFSSVKKAHGSVQLL
jgi:hypothetical protein